jgi:hypothetical protein
MIEWPETVVIGGASRSMWRGARALTVHGTVKEGRDVFR